MGGRFPKNLRFKREPSLLQNTGASCVGLGASSTSELNEENENREDENDPFDITPVTCIRKSVATKLKTDKKLKLSAETEETSKLTTGELQRLLLHEQIKLTRLQAERERLMITELNLRAAQHRRTESVEQRVVVERRRCLKRIFVVEINCILFPYAHLVFQQAMLSLTYCRPMHTHDILI